MYTTKFVAVYIAGKVGLASFKAATQRSLHGWWNEKINFLSKFECKIITDASYVNDLKSIGALKMKSIALMPEQIVTTKMEFLDYPGKLC